MATLFEEMQRLVQLRGTKANLLNLIGTLAEVTTVFATDTGEFGLYDGSTFNWIGTPSGTMVQDEGTSKGLADTFNFVGPNVDASVAGGVARIFITGSGGASPSGTMVQDEGVPQGLVGALNFVGPNVDASVVGGVGRIFITGSSGSGKYRQFTYAVISGTFSFIQTPTGTPVLALQLLE